MKKIIHKKLKKTSEKIKLFFKGFTIIELITVIAIIGVLASVILVYVTSYVGKSRDSRIKAEISEIAKDAMIYYSNNVSYEGYAIPNSFRPVVLGSDYEFSTDGVNSYVVYAKLSTSNDYWCIDHTGAVLQIDNPPDEGVYVCISGSGGEEIICGNGSCEGGEDCENCSVDCGCLSDYCETCISGVCESTCNSSNCESCMMGTCNYFCQTWETCENEMCVSIGPFCGNNECEEGEDCENCSVDCGFCF
jgi:prepilin-type N-terminal cleavage/methylation domain-containing protein